MASISETQYKKIKSLYEDGLSMQEISRRLNTSLNAVTYAMRKGGISRRSQSEVQSIRFKKKPASFTRNKIRTNYEKRIIDIGLSLYWAEGYKTTKSSSVDFANSDYKMIEAFMKFLRTTYTLDEKRLRVLLYCYSNQDINQLIEFWEKVTSIPKEQFTKPYIRNDFKEGKIMEYGMVHIRYSDKKLLHDIIRQIEILKDKICVGTQEVNEGTL